jgi:hypothetical protein
LRFPKDDDKITSALTYEGIAGRRKIRPDRIAKHVFEAGNGPVSSKLSVRPQTFRSVLYTVLKIPQIAARIRSGSHQGESLGVPAPNHP